MNAQRPRPRLYLFTPQLEDTTNFLSALDAALAAGDVAAVLLRLADADERTLINRVKSIGAVVQRRDIALLLDGRPEIVGRAGADGAHLTGIASLRGALATLKPDRIAGAGGLRSRDDAMLAGEANPDYVMFGEPDRRGNQGKRPQFLATVERVEWWAELFQLPCIGYAAAADEIRPLAKAGAEFVALGEWIWEEPGGAKAVVAAAADSLTAAAA
jgi:thiamine-phosphate pyrophosphorylase